MTGQIRHYKRFFNVNKIKLNKMSENTLSLIRHILTALGTVLTLLGLTKYTGIVDYLTNNLDAVQAAIVTILGVVTAIWGYFKNGNRFALRANLKAGK